MSEDMAWREFRAACRQHFAAGGRNLPAGALCRLYQSLGVLRGENYVFVHADSLRLRAFHEAEMARWDLAWAAGRDDGTDRNGG